MGQTQDPYVCSGLCTREHQCEHGVSYIQIYETKQVYGGFSSLDLTLVLTLCDKGLPGKLGSVGLEDSHVFSFLPQPHGIPGFLLSSQS